MRIEALAVQDFPPFADDELTFPAKPEGSKLAEVQILTGQNGTGKTRLLSILAAALGNDSELKHRINGSDCKAAVVARIGAPVSRLAGWGRVTECGWIAQSKPSIMLKQLLKGGPENWSAQLLGVFGSSEQKKSHKISDSAAMSFRGIAQIADAKLTALKPVKIEDPLTLLRFDKTTDEDTQIGQSLVNIKMGAAMERLSNDDGQSVSRASLISQGLEDAVSEITGRRFRFSVTPYPEITLRVNWGGATMKFNQLPDGLRCIIGWLAGCIAKLDALFPEHPDPFSIPLFLLLDEPEGHLHPAWQRKLIPAVQSLFPNGQFFVATHSPFVISSVNEGWIHVLRADAETGKVSFDQPRACSKGDSYVEIVQDILGVSEWYDPESEKLLSQFRCLKDDVLAGAWEKEQELADIAKGIATRSDTLADLVGGEMRQFERQKKQAKAAA